jgi:hypothetical protein
MTRDDHLLVGVPDRRHQLAGDSPHQLVGDLVDDLAGAVELERSLDTAAASVENRRMTRWPHQCRRPTSQSS